MFEWLLLTRTTIPSPGQYRLPERVLSCIESSFLLRGLSENLRLYRELLREILDLRDWVLALHCYSDSAPDTSSTRITFPLPASSIGELAERVGIFMVNDTSEP